MPEPVTAPFAARRNEAIGDRDRQWFYPVGALTAGGQMLGPERVQGQLAPQFARQPAGPVLAGTAQTVVAQAEGDRGPGQIGGDGPVVGKQAQALPLPCGVIKNRDGLDPGRLLGVTQFAQVEEGFLERSAPARLADVLHDAVVAMLFAIFLAGIEAQKHNLARVCQSHQGLAQGGGSPLQHFSGFWELKNAVLLGNSSIGLAKIVKTSLQYRKAG